MNKEKIESLINTNEEDVNFAIHLSDTIVKNKTKDLDELMRDIQDNVVNKDNNNDFMIEKYLSELTNALYFINTRCEYFGFYEDITKANARLKYNELYSENQLKNASAKIKATVADNQLYAEINSVDEAMLSLIYSRSMRIIKGKIESASEMIRTLSKILSVHMNEKQLSKLTDN